MEPNQELRGGMGSTNYQAARDIRVGFGPDEVRKIVEGVTETLRPSQPTPVALPGWVRITPDYLSKKKPRADLGDYFDGATPDWRHTCHPQLRPRPVVMTIVQEFRTEELEDRTILMRIGGATGDGKSTILQQAVALLAREACFDAIYWRGAADARLTPDVVTSMRAVGRKILIASDDAEALLADIDHFAGTRLHESDVFVHFLLASRDVDWVAEQSRLGWKLSLANRWASAFRVKSPVRTGHIELADAQVVADNWLNCSSSRPARLSSGNASTVARAMLDVSRASHGRQAFMGGVLAMRFDTERLRTRLTSLLSALDNVHPGDPHVSLADLLVLLAAVDIGGIESGIPRDISARFLKISESALRPSVEVPLKGEFFLGTSSRALFARHPNVSKALLEQALDEDSTLHVEDSLEKFISDVVQIGMDSSFRPGFGQLIDLGRRLMDGILPRDVIGPVALHLCRTACALAPPQLSTHIALSRTLRDLRQSDLAITEVWESVSVQLDKAPLWGDYSDHVRGAWGELSAALGTSGHKSSSFWAAQVSISDRPAAKISAGQVTISLNRLALQAKLACEEGAEQEEFLDLLTQVEALTRTANSDFFHEEGYPTRYLEYLGIPPRQFGGSGVLVAAIRRAAKALSASRQSLDWCHRLADPMDDSFTALDDLLGRLVK